ncbi:hypothetical protein BCR44DRAFT_55457, partial [Catenaria anguillulae PL171]
HPTNHPSAAAAADALAPVQLPDVVVFAVDFSGSTNSSPEYWRSIIPTSHKELETAIERLQGNGGTAPQVIAQYPSKSTVSSSKRACLAHTSLNLSVVAPCARHSSLQFTTTNRFLAQGDSRLVHDTSAGELEADIKTPQDLFDRFQELNNAIVVQNLGRSNPKLRGALLKLQARLVALVYLVIVQLVPRLRENEALMAAFRAQFQYRLLKYDTNLALSGQAWVFARQGADWRCSLRNILHELASGVLAWPVAGSDDTWEAGWETRAKVMRMFMYLLSRKSEVDVLKADAQRLYHASLVVKPVPIDLSKLVSLVDRNKKFSDVLIPRADVTNLAVPEVKCNYGYSIVESMQFATAPGDEKNAIGAIPVSRNHAPVCHG